MSSDGGTRTEEVPVQYCQRFVQRLAEHRSRCSGGTVAAWTERLWLQSPEGLNCQQSVRAVHEQRAVFVADLAAACLQQLADSACGDAMDEVLHQPQGACRQAIQGLVQDGASCIANAECQEGSFCNFFQPGVSGSVFPGTCTQFAQSGGDCYWSDCEYPLTCEPSRSGMSYTCKDLLRQVGEKCSEEAICRRGYCRVTYENPARPWEFEGVCEAPKHEGACEQDAECDPRFYCDRAPRSRLGECRPRKAPGASCTPNPSWETGSSAFECEQFARCEGAPATCMRMALIGEPCRAFGGPTCLSGSCQVGSDWVNGVCTQPEGPPSP